MEWWGREITGSDGTAPLAGPWPRVASDETDLLQVGFVFLGSVMLVKLKTMR